MTECVFCTRREQPAALFETPSLYVMPDKFPMTAGHTLTICKAHLPCYAAASDAVLQELEGVTARVRRFLRGAYGVAAMVWENGVAGQTVHHAHLHLLPISTPGLPRALDDAELVPVDGWEAVRRHYRRHGCYRYVDFGDDRRLIAAYSPVMRQLRGFMEQQLGVRWSAEKGDWIRPTTPEDVREVGRRWARWVEGQMTHGEET